jgi:hypothetical protein
MARQKWLYHISTGIAVGIVLAGCTGFKDPSPKNFTGALNTYYGNHDDCLFQSKLQFPYEASTAPSEKDPKIKSLDALEGAGLLKSLEDRDIHVKRYALTTYGQRVPPRFCYGHRVVTSIDGFTPAAAVDGMKAMQVNYHYKMMDIPGWADSDQMRKAFPDYAKASSPDAQGQTTVVLTQNGWRVPE